jgi:membrane protein YdbS with pleckstrin-like domain
VFTSYEPSQISKNISRHLDSTEKVMIARRFHWATLLLPAALIVLGVFVTIGVDVVLPTNGRNSHAVAWALWGLWLLWVFHAIFGIGKARTMLSKNRTNTFIALAIVVAVGYLLSRLASDKRYGAGGILLLVLLAVVAWGVYQIAEWADRYFVLTNKRIVVIEGIITTTVRSMPVSRLTDMAYRRTGIGRALGYGLFDVESAGQDQALKIMNFVPNPEFTNLQISNLLFGKKTPDPKNIVLNGQVNPATGNMSITGQMDG